MRSNPFFYIFQLCKILHTQHTRPSYTHTHPTLVHTHTHTHTQGYVVRISGGNDNFLMKINKVSSLMAVLSSSSRRGTVVTDPDALEIGNASQ